MIEGSADSEDQTDPRRGEGRSQKPGLSWNDGKEEADQQTRPPEQRAASLKTKTSKFRRQETRRKDQEAQAGAKERAIIPGSGSWMPYETKYSVLYVVVADSGLEWAEKRTQDAKNNATRGTVNESKQAIGFFELRV